MNQEKKSKTKAPKTKEPKKSSENKESKQNKKGKQNNRVTQNKENKQNNRGNKKAKSKRNKVPQNVSQKMRMKEIIDKILKDRLSKNNFENVYKLEGLGLTRIEYKRPKGTKF
jgi:hypothetical protein